jgi:peptidoglycan L-alanyl-D-glutamate endopeptidase CwlK
VTFRYGAESQAKLRDGLSPELVRAASFAIEVTEQDFCIWETKRSMQRALALEAANASHAGARSHHVPDAAGVVHALDAVPWIAGGPRWITAPGLVVAKAWHRAARKFDIPITWGGVWDRELAALDPTCLEQEHIDYLTRFRARNGRGALSDIWHFQVPRT